MQYSTMMALGKIKWKDKQAQKRLNILNMSTTNYYIIKNIIFLTVNTS